MGTRESRSASVIFGGGPNDVDSVVAALDGVLPEFVIAADSGLAPCVEVGLTCDAVVGDMDSVDPSMLEAVCEAGAIIERHDVAKDSTDLELALDYAVRVVRPESDLIVVASPRGRLDHLFASATIIGSPRYSLWNIEGFLGRARVLPVHHRRSISAPPGTTASVLALHGPARGVSVTGMRWPLHDAVLDAATTLGVSNEFESAAASFEVARGVLTVVIPDQGDL